MAIAKARTGSPVRGYYVTTINTGRIVQLSGSGFGLPRLGGLWNAQVEGLAGGSSATTRLAAQAHREAFATQEAAEAKALAKKEAAHKGDKEATPKESVLPPSVKHDAPPVKHDTPTKSEK